MSGYTQLTQEQRYQLEVLLKAGHNQTMIANILAIHKSTVSRELRRIVVTVRNKLTRRLCRDGMKKLKLTSP